MVDATDGWRQPVDVTRLLGDSASAVVAWGGRGKLAGSVRDEAGLRVDVGKETIPP